MRKSLCCFFLLISMTLVTANAYAGFPPPPENVKPIKIFERFGGRYDVEFYMVDKVLYSKISILKKEGLGLHCPEIGLGAKHEFKFYTPENTEEVLVNTPGIYRVGTKDNNVSDFIDTTKPFTIELMQDDSHWSHDYKYPKDFLK